MAKKAPLQNSNQPIWPKFVLLGLGGAVVLALVLLALSLNTTAPSYSIGNLALSPTAALTTAPGSTTANSTRMGADHTLAPTAAPTAAPSTSVVAAPTVVSSKATLLSTLDRPASTLAWSPDGSILALGSFKQGVTPQVELQLLRPDGKPLAILKGHTDTISTLAWSPDGKVLASGSSDGTVRLWQPAKNYASLLLLNEKEAKSPVTTVAWSSDSQLVAVGYSQNTIRIWKKDGTPYTQLEGNGPDWPVSSLAWSPLGKTLAAGFADGRIYLWNISGPQPVPAQVWPCADQFNQLKGEQRGIVCHLAWSPNTKLLASASSEGNLKIWASVGQNLATLYKKQLAPNGLAWSPDGKLLAVGSEEGVQLYDESTRLVATMPGEVGLPCSLAWSPDSKSLAATFSSAAPRVWQIGGRDLASLIFLGSGTEPARSSCPFCLISWSPNGTELALANTYNAGFVQLWKLEQKAGATTPATTVSAATATSGPGAVTSSQPVVSPEALSAFGGQGKLAFVQAGKLYLLNGNSKALISLTLPEGQVERLAWSAYGDWLAYTLYDQTSNTTSVWTVREDGSANHPYEGYRNFSWMPDADGLELVGKEGEENGLWLASPGGTPSQKITAAGPVGSASWSPDGTMLAYVTTSLAATKNSTATSATSPNASANPNQAVAALYTVSLKSGVSTLRYTTQPGDCLKFTGWWGDSGGLTFQLIPTCSASLAADGLPLQSLALGSANPKSLPVTLNYPGWSAVVPNTHELIMMQGAGREVWQSKTLTGATFKPGNVVLCPNHPVR